TGNPEFLKNFDAKTQDYLTWMAQHPESDSRMKDLFSHDWGGNYIKNRLGRLGLNPLMKTLGMNTGGNDLKDVPYFNEYQASKQVGNDALRAPVESHAGDVLKGLSTELHSG